MSETTEHNLPTYMVITEWSKPVQSFTDLPEACQFARSTESYPGQRTVLAGNDPRIKYSWKA